MTPQAPTRRRALFWLLLVLIAAAALRLWRLPSLPPGFHLDESFEGLEAWRILTDPTYRPIFLQGNFGVPPLNAWANALMFGVGGWFGVPAGPTLMRLTAAIFGVLGVAAVAWVAWELAALENGRRRALFTRAFPLLTAAALAVMRWHIHFSRMGIEPILMPLEWALAAALLLHALRTGRWWAYGALGFVTASTLYTYQGAWHYPLVLAVVAVTSLLAHRREALQPLVRRVAGLALAGGLALMLAAPLLLFLWRNPDLALLRPTQISVVGETASPADSSLLSTTLQTLAMFWPFGETGDLDPRRNLPGAPALPLLLALPFFLGLALAVRYITRPAGWVLLISLPSLLAIGFVSEYAPHFHRVLGAAAPVALLIGWGLDSLGRWAGSYLARFRLDGRSRQALTWLLPLLLLVGGAGTGARDYFVRWAALPDLFHAFDEGLWQVGTWMAELPADERVYLSPRSLDHPTLAFALATRSESSPTPVTFDGRLVVPVTEGPAPSAETYIAIEHEDFRTPLLLPGLLPQATVVRQWADRSGAPYAAAWERPAGSEPARTPQFTVNAPIGDGIRLLGYDVLPESIRAGEILYLQLHWLVESTPSTDWTVFTHLTPVDAANPLAGKDAQPGGGSLPTTHWLTGWRVLDEYQIPVPADLAAGAYGLRIGLYTPGGASLPEGGAVVLGTVQIERP